MIFIFLALCCCVHVELIAAQTDPNCPRNHAGDCVDGDWGDYENCTTYWTCSNCIAVQRLCPAGLHFSTCTQQCEREDDACCGENSAFFVGRTSNLNSNQDPVQFQEVVVNDGENWSPSLHRFQAPEQGFYLLTMSAGAQAHNNLQLDLTGSAGLVPINLYRTSVRHAANDMMGREMIQEVPDGATMQLASTFPTSRLASNPNLLTSFGGVDLSRNMIPFIGFTVSRSSLWFEEGRVQFTHVDVDEGAGWDDSEHAFVAPRSGIYYFSFSTGVYPGENVHIDLMVNDESQVALSRDQITHNGIDMLTRSTLLELVEGDMVQLNLTYGAMFSDSERQIAFTGFLYEPANITSFAWSVHKDSNWISSGAALDPVPFETILVNEGDAFDNNTNTVNITISGLYLLNLNVGAYQERQVDAHMAIDDIPSFFNCVRDTDYHDDGDALGRTVFMYLYEGEVLHIVAAPNTALRSDENLHTSFSGMLIYRI